MGDSLSGKKLPPIISGRWVEAVRRFVSSNRAFKGSTSLTPSDYQPQDSLPALPLHGSAIISFGPARLVLQARAADPLLHECLF